MTTKTETTAVHNDNGDLCEECTRIQSKHSYRVMTACWLSYRTTSEKESRPANVPGLRSRLKFSGDL